MEELLDEAPGVQAEGVVSHQVGDIRVEADVVEGMGELLFDPARVKHTLSGISRPLLPVLTSGS